MIPLRKSLTASALLLSCITAYTPANAAIQVLSTRVVYSGDSNAATLDLVNNAKQPYMVQSWLDTGDQTQIPKGLPMIVTPPLLKLAPGRHASLRFIYSGHGLPGDKESLFWVNVQEIPPEAKQANVLQIAIRTRIKLFYRPAGIDSSLDNASKSLKWTLKGNALYVSNPSPLHITFASLTAKDGQHTANFDTDMINPGQTAEVLHGALAKALATNHAFGFEYINDYGGYDHVNAQVEASTQ
ncbi:putative fimbrial chaperone LpfB [Halomonadaceae bacterium LMG 33818]|uniref:fimbrial biogenesis chaperone n=1 Tax=Cernens ardua TaxID=3402176 RepID=UPI003EDCB0DE